MPNALTADQVHARASNLVPLEKLGDEALAAFLAAAEVQQLAKGRFVFREGDNDDYAFFLLDGELALYADQKLVQRVVAGTEAARHPLAQLKPRQLSALAGSTVTVLAASRSALAHLNATAHSSAQNREVEVSEVEDDEPVDWMTRLLQSEVFARLPAENLQRIFAVMESVSADAGDVIVRQGDAGDYFYIIEKGRCRVTRQARPPQRPLTLAMLGPGTSFGEEAILSGAARNATVTMETDGSLMRLSKGDFVQLVRNPTLNGDGISYVEAQRLLESGATWIDVRLPEEQTAAPIAGSISLPFHLMRQEAKKLESGKPYIVVCDTGERSSVGAYLLVQAKHEAFYLKGGLQDNAWLRGGSAQSQQPAGREPHAEASAGAERQPRLRLVASVDEHPSTLPPPQTEAPASQPGAQEQAARGAEARSSSPDELAALEAELRSLKRQLEDQRMHAESETARQAAEVARLTRIAQAAENRLASAQEQWEVSASKAKAQIVELGRARIETDAAARAAAEASSARIGDLTEELATQERRARHAEAEIQRLQQNLEGTENARKQAAEQSEATGDSLRRRIKRLERQHKETRDRLTAETERAAKVRAQFEQQKKAADAALEEERSRRESAEKALQQTAKSQPKRQGIRDAERVARQLAETRQELKEAKARHAAEVAALEANSEEVRKTAEDERQTVELALAELGEQLDQMQSQAKADARHAEEKQRALAESLRSEFEGKRQTMEREHAEALAAQQKAFEEALAQKDAVVAQLKEDKETAERSSRETIADFERRAEEYARVREAIRRREDAALQEERDRLAAEIARVQHVMASASHARTEAERHLQAARAAPESRGAPPEAHPAPAEPLEGRLLSRDEVEALRQKAQTIMARKQKQAS